MSDNSKPTVYAEHRVRGNAFDKDDDYSGQQYHRDAEAEQGRIDGADDKQPRDRSTPQPPPPEDPDAFKVPGA